MHKIIRTLKYIFLFILIAVVTGCAPSKQNPYLKKRQAASKVIHHNWGEQVLLFKRLSEETCEKL